MGGMLLAPTPVPGHCGPPFPLAVAFSNIRVLAHVESLFRPLPRRMLKLPSGCSGDQLPMAAD